MSQGGRRSLYSISGGVNNHVGLTRKSVTCHMGHIGMSTADTTVYACDDNEDAYGCSLLGSRGNREALLILFSFKNNMMTRSRPVVKSASTVI